MGDTLSSFVSIAQRHLKDHIFSIAFFFFAHVRLVTYSFSTPVSHTSYSHVITYNSMLIGLAVSGSTNRSSANTEAVGERVSFLSHPNFAPHTDKFNSPVITTDFPDPSIIKVDDTWYAFGTHSLYDNTDINIQVATSSDFSSWSLSQGTDALPNLPSWVDASNPLTWAPDVNLLVSPHPNSLSRPASSAN